MDTIKEYLAEKQAMVEAALQNCVQPSNPQAKVIFDAMEYSLLAGGKRLRPVLFLTVLESFGQPIEKYLSFACGLEMIHTYSLIHDDLPAMDNDDLRRGKPTCHKVFGEANAILAGDGLLTHSFVNMLALADSVPLARLVAATKEVALAAGLQGMVIGQVVDLASENQLEPVELEQLKYIHKYKTGALFSCALVSAGILAGINTDSLAALKSYAEYFGLAFQIVDDILDVVGDEATLGKPIGSDAKNHKATYPNLLGMDSAKAEAKKAVASAVSSLEPLGEQGIKLKEIVVYLLDRKF